MGLTLATQPVLYEPNVVILVYLPLCLSEEFSKYASSLGFTVVDLQYSKKKKKIQTMIVEGPLKD
jgi:hypothetical protein